MDALNDTFPGCLSCVNSKIREPFCDLECTLKNHNHSHDQGFIIVNTGELSCSIVPCPDYKQEV